MASNFLGHNLSYEAAPQYLQCTINISNYYLFTGPSSLVFILKKLKRDNTSYLSDGSIPQIPPTLNPLNYSDKFYYGTDISTYASCEEMPQFKYSNATKYQSLFPFISLCTSCKPRKTANDLCSENVFYGPTQFDVNTATVINLHSFKNSGFIANGIMRFKKNGDSTCDLVNPVYNNYNTFPYYGVGVPRYWADTLTDPDGIINGSSSMPYTLMDPILDCRTDLAGSVYDSVMARAWKHTCLNPCIYGEYNFNQCRYMQNEGQTNTSPFGQTRCYGMDFGIPYFDPTTAVISAYP